MPVNEPGRCTDDLVPPHTVLARLFLDNPFGRFARFAAARLPAKLLVI